MCWKGQTKGRDHNEIPFGNSGWPVRVSRSFRTKPILKSADLQGALQGPLQGALQGVFQGLILALFLLIQLSLLFCKNYLIHSGNYS